VAVRTLSRFKKKGTEDIKKKQDVQVAQGREKKLRSIWETREGRKKIGVSL